MKLKLEQENNDGSTPSEAVLAARHSVVAGLTMVHGVKYRQNSGVIKEMMQQQETETVNYMSAVMALVSQLSRKE